MSPTILHSLPERPDPFRFFANYPTQSLGIADSIRIAGDDDIGRLLDKYDEIIALKMFSSYLPSILPRFQVEKLLTLIWSGCVSVENISISLEVEPSLVLRTVSFMIKIGILEKVFD